MLNANLCNDLNFRCRSNSINCRLLTAFCYLPAKQFGQNEIDTTLI